MFSHKMVLQKPFYDISGSVFFPIIISFLSGRFNKVGNIKGSEAFDTITGIQHGSHFSSTLLLPYANALSNNILRMSVNIYDSKVYV